jgi:hypothetical protein
MERNSSSEEINQAVSDAAMISSARTTKSTKDQYGRKLVHAVSWFKDRHHQVVRVNDIRSRKRGKYHSFEHVSGPMSAIRDGMKTRRFRSSVQIDNGCGLCN